MNIPARPIECLHLSALAFFLFGSSPLLSSLPAASPFFDFFVEALRFFSPALDSPEAATSFLMAFPSHLTLEAEGMAVSASEVIACLFLEDLRAALTFGVVWPSSPLSSLSLLSFLTFSAFSSFFFFVAGSSVGPASATAELLFWISNLAFSLSNQRVHAFWVRPSGSLTLSHLMGPALAISVMSRAYYPAVQPLSFKILSSPTFSESVHGFLEEPSVSAIVVGWDAW
ncbi:hypothetical protein BJ546DRAFT_56282 [Cryomyces antarcticus]